MPTITEQLQKLIKRQALLLWPELDDKLPAIKVDRPTDKRHGDYSTNLPMQLGSVLKRAPLEIAEALKAKDLILPCLEPPLIAPPGYINFTLKPDWVRKQPGRILKTGADYGRNDLGHNQKLHLEFISANPTGPLHLGNGRGGFTGDVLGNLLAFSGFRVHREYYVNDVGKQVDTLAESIIRRFFQLQGIPMEYPEHCYQGSYIIELAKKLKLEGLKLKDIEHAKQQIKGRALRSMLSIITHLIRDTAMIKFDRYYRESELSKKKLPERVLKILREKNVVEERDGALWMKTTEFGDDKDRVLIKSDGERTYFLSDIAYLYDKFAVRKFDQAILLLGADHHGYVDRMAAAARALGFPDRLDVKIFQLVRLIENGQEVRMSKRSGTFVTLEELIRDAGLDVARFFFLMVGNGTHMDFDLTLAKEHSEKNPVYYVQYAHARICSILRNTKPLIRKGHTAKTPRLEDLSALNLAKKLLEFPELVADSARTRTVNELTGYAIQTAAAFHDFYTKFRIISDGTVNLPGLELVQATQLVLRQTLGLLGVKAPEKM